MGRLLQVIGWLWVAAGFLAPLTGRQGFNVLPGLILVFIARAIRTQAARNAPEEPDEAEPARVEQVERPLNTQRTRPTAPPPSPDPVVRYQEAEPRSEPEPAEIEEEPVPEREGLIERIVIAGRDAEHKESSQDRLESARVPRDHGRRPVMSSAEMIAQARKRWDRKP